VELVGAKRDWSAESDAETQNSGPSRQNAFAYRSGWIQAGLSEPRSAKGSLCALLVEDLTERPIIIGFELLLGLRVRHGSRTPKAKSQ
jgi:hypothetical protein